MFAPHLERLMDGYAEIVEADIPIAGKNARAYSLEFVDRIRSVKDDNARINIIETGETSRTRRRHRPLPEL